MNIIVKYIPSILVEDLNLQITSDNVSVSMSTENKSSVDIGFINKIFTNKVTWDSIGNKPKINSHELQCGNNDLASLGIINSTSISSIEITNTLK